MSYLYGRRYRIRTYDPLLPKQVRYQTALISDLLSIVIVTNRTWVNNYILRCFFIELNLSTMSVCSLISLHLSVTSITPLSSLALCAWTRLGCAFCVCIHSNSLNEVWIFVFRVIFLRLRRRFIVLSPDLTYAIYLKLFRFFRVVLPVILRIHFLFIVHIH